MRRTNVDMTRNILNFGSANRGEGNDSWVDIMRRELEMKLLSRMKWMLRAPQADSSYSATRRCEGEASRLTGMSHLRQHMTSH